MIPSIFPTERWKYFWISHNHGNILYDVRKIKIKWQVTGTNFSNIFFCFIKKLQISILILILKFYYKLLSLCKREKTHVKEVKFWPLYEGLISFSTKVVMNLVGMLPMATIAMTITYIFYIIKYHTKILDIIFTNDEYKQNNNI